MNELDELANKFHDHLIIGKCLHYGNIHIELDHIDNDFDNQLDYLKGFRELEKIISMKA